jgi:hypothetical protein
MRNISHLFAAGQFPTFERDPEITKMENAVFTKMNNILQDLAVVHGQQNIANEPIRFVSVEDAMKELAEMQKNGLL